MVIMVKESAGIDCIDKDIANNISVEILELIPIVIGKLPSK